MRSRLLIAAAVAATALAASYYCRAGVSTLIAPDTATYWATPGDLITRTSGSPPIRTPQYSVMFAAVQLAGGAGRVFLAVQGAVRALAVGWLAWLFAGESPLAGLVAGGLLALDPVSASVSNGYLSESVYSSALIIALGIGTWQLSSERRWSRRALLVAGALFGVCLLVRPTSAGLLGVAVLAYGIATRSPWRAAWVGAGGAIAVAGICLYHYLRTGFFMIVTTGLFVAFPLFVQHMMDPSNGRASRTLHRDLTACDPAIDYSQVSLANVNPFVYRTLLPCTLAQHGGDSSRVYRLYAAAYREALLAHPLTSSWRLFLESCRFLGGSVAYYGTELIAAGQGMKRGDLCARRWPYDAYPPGLIAFVCPLPETNDGVRRAVERSLIVMRLLYQPYLYVYRPELMPASLEYREGRSPELVGATALLYFFIAWLIAHPRYRMIMGGAVLVIVYNAAATAFGQVTIPRYIGPMSPFYLIVTGLVLTSLLERAVALVRSRDAHGPAGVEARSA